LKLFYTICKHVFDKTGNGLLTSAATRFFY